MFSLQISLIFAGMSEILVIIGLVFLNGLFAMAEISLVSARKSRLEAQSGKGSSDAKRALDLINRPDLFLSTVQIGITVIGLLMGIFSGEQIKTDLMDWLQKFSMLRPYSGVLSTIIVVVSIAYLSLVLGELVPKRIGMSNPERIAKRVAGPMRIVIFIMFPFIWLLTKSSNLIVNIFNIHADSNQVTEDEIKAVVNEGTEQGAIEEVEQEMIHRVFHLNDRNITSLMTHRTDITWVDTSLKVGEVKHKVGEIVHSVYPVCDGQIDNVKGLLFVKDMFMANDDTPVTEIMKTALYVPENNTAYQVLEKFKEEKVHCCFIVDEYGTIHGLITLNDILGAIIGDIPQTDEVAYAVHRRADGSLLVDGQIPFYDFLHQIDKTELLDEDVHQFDTLAGFALHELKEIPRTGDSFEWQDLIFEIVDMDNNRIDKVLVTKKKIQA